MSNDAPRKEPWDRRLAGRLARQSREAANNPSFCRPVRSWQRSAPPPIGGPLVASYGLILLPASLGAIWAWPPLSTAALLVPGFILYGVLCNRAAKARSVYALPRDVRMLSGVCGGFVVAVADIASPRHVLPLAFALILVAVADPLSRAMWRRRGQ
jgi:hypothetical protein